MCWNLGSSPDSTEGAYDTPQALYLDFGGWQVKGRGRYWRGEKAKKGERGKDDGGKEKQRKHFSFSTLAGLHRH